MNNSQRPGLSRKLVSVQMLRAAAAISVLIAHVVEHPQLNAPNGALITGRFGVEIFFSISGFIIFNVCGKESFNLRSFLVRRAARVIPLYWITTTVVAASVFLSPLLYKTTTFDAIYYFKSMLFIPADVPSIPGDWRPIYKLGWTINYEVFFYLCVSSLFWCRNLGLRVAILSFLLLALVLIGELHGNMRTSVFYFYASGNLLPFIAGFFIGYLQEMRLRLAMRFATPLFALIFVVTTCVLYHIDFANLSEFWPHLVMTCAAVSCLCFGLSLERHLKNLDSGILVVIGDSSYSLYLLHMFFVGLWVAVLKSAGISGLAFWALVATCIPAAIIVSVFSYRLVEVPLNRAGSVLAGRKLNASLR